MCVHVKKNVDKLVIHVSFYVKSFHFCTTALVDHTLTMTDLNLSLFFFFLTITVTFLQPILSQLPLNRLQAQNLDPGENVMRQK